MVLKSSAISRSEFGTRYVELETSSQVTRYKIQDTRELERESARLSGQEVCYLDALSQSKLLSAEL